MPKGLFKIFFTLLVLQQSAFPQTIFVSEDDSITSFGRCITPKRDKGHCVILHDCKYLLNILVSEPLKDAESLYLSRSQCGFYNDNVLICCPNRSRPITVTTVNDLLPRPGQCGNVISNRIYGGNKTKIDEFPWMALLEYTKPYGAKGYYCGGALINHRYVITASHCVNGKAIPNSWRLTAVRLGEWDTATNPDCEIDARGEKDCAPKHIDVQIERSIVHPQYNPNSRNHLNDIALLRLERSVDYTDFVTPICLPVNKKLRTAVLDGIVMEVSGWGQTEQLSSSRLKLKASVKGYNNTECRSIYMRQNIILDDNQICAGGKEGIDSCRGDSGGPLIGLATTSRVHTYYFQAGIVSFGPTPCGYEGWPAVYTRVGNYIDWILQNIES